MDAQVLISAGHEGTVRNSGSGTKRTYGAGGTARPEREMTPIVADGATAWLRHYGISVVREDAYFSKKYEVDLALHLHFDGSNTPCASGASVGYPEGVPAGSNQPTADLWKEIYSEYWPFKWMPDNFSNNLKYYYGYSWASTSVAELLIEFGEISCPEQDEWLQPRVGTTGAESELGLLVAYFASEALGLHVVPNPGVPDNGEVERLWDDVWTSYRNLGRRLERLDDYYRPEG